MAISKRSILAGVFGNALEWYDFTAYAFLAPILAELFFPAHDPFISLLLTFSVFALGFLVRPLGAFLFGYLGDKLGRRKALITSIITMSVPTLLLGLLPTYAAIGILAPILLTLLRLFQGTAVSGELTSAAAYLVEHAGERRRGWAGSLVMCSAFVGITLSSAIVTLFTESTTQEQLLSWGWRLPFLLGGAIGLIGLIVRLRSAETHLFEHSQKTSSAATITLLPHLMNTLRHRAVWLAMALTCIMAVGNWFLIAYFNTFLIKNIHLPAKSVMLINFLVLCIFTLLLPLIGILSDNLGRKPVLRIGVIGFVLLSYPIFSLLNHGSVMSAFFGQLLFAVILAFVAAIIPTALAELFEVRTRNSGMALGYNFSLAVFGGTAPLIAIALVARTGNHFAPAYYLILCALISWVALNRLKESFRETLQ